MDTVQFRRKLDDQDFAISATEVNVDGRKGRLALLEDDVAGTKMQLTEGELRWLCFVAGPDVLRAMEGE